MCKGNKAIHTNGLTLRPTQNTAALAISWLLRKERGPDQGAGEPAGEVNSRTETTFVDFATGQSPTCGSTVISQPATLCSNLPSVGALLDDVMGSIKFPPNQRCLEALIPVTCDYDLICRQDLCR